MTHSQPREDDEPTIVPADAAAPRIVTDLAAELADLAASARKSSEREAASARFWHRLHLAIGLPTAVLAGAAAVTGLATAAGRVPAAILALVVAGLSAASTFLGCESRAQAAEQRASAWAVLSLDARTAGYPVGFEEDGRKERETVIGHLNVLTARQGAILRGDVDSALAIRERTLGIRGRREPDWELTTPTWGGGAGRVPYLADGTMQGGGVIGGGVISNPGPGGADQTGPRNPGGSAPFGPYA